MADVDQILSRLKSYKVVTIVVTIAAILAGVASFTDSVRKVTEFARGTFLPTSPNDHKNVLTITSSSPLPWSDAELQDAYRFRIFVSESARYSLAVHVKLRFKNPSFNTKPYLESIRPLGVTKLPDNSPTYYLEQTDIADYVLYLKFQEQPRPKQELQLAAGPHLWTIQLGAHLWKSYQRSTAGNKRFQWWGTQGTLLLTLADPDWPILSSVRLLPLRQPETSLLEVIVENRSDVPLALQQLILGASHPRRHSAIRCAMGDPTQQVTFNWPAMIATAPTGEAVPSWTTLREGDVSVPTEFSVLGGCSDAYFHADVPLQVDVAPKELKRISFKLLELVGESTHPGDGTLTTLRNWRSLSVSLKSSNLPLSPESFAIIDRGQSGQSDALSAGHFRRRERGRSRGHPPAISQFEKDTGLSESIRSDRGDDTSFFFMSMKDNMVPVLTGDTSPEEAAIAFFSKYAARFRMEDPRHELALERIVTDEGGSSVRFTQHVNQVPVYGTTIDVHFNTTGQIHLIGGTYIPNVLGMSTKPTYDAAAAVAKAKADLSALFLRAGMDLSAASPTPQLIIFVLEGTPVLAYQLHLTDGDMQDRDGQLIERSDPVWADYVINAKTGDIMMMNGNPR